MPVILVQFQLNDAHKGGKEKARRAKLGSTEFTNHANLDFLGFHPLARHTSGLEREAPASSRYGEWKAVRVGRHARS